jgi:hypothetical protein
MRREWTASLVLCGVLAVLWAPDSDAFAGVDDEYCAPDCSGDQRCPNGFSCNSVISVKQEDLCQVDADCQVCLVTLDSCANSACEPVDCIHNDGVNYGGCVSGQGCGLIEGVHCPDPANWP